ncbi:oligosaccharide flippase family protein [Metallosphaera sedula]|uniref:oligosaccharide flippase family protein n=1 Tax=Metallosphaera sedula TaxID=43687 RepID=UPI0021FD7BC6|nr:oligosaccharide flippase family protein [Metallosphaera sedula]BBL47980.1 polysaccharide biosynthesis protein [Metallosphaera sedula]
MMYQSKIMNPLTGSLKFLATTLLNSITALLFFLIVAHFSSPSFVGKVTIIQLIETITGSFFALLPLNLVTRDVSHKYASSQDHKKVVSTSLSYSLLVSPFLLFLFLFPSYVWLSIPYFVLYLFFTYQSRILSGLGKFSETNLGNVIFTVTRWGISSVAVFYHSISLLILIWTLGALVKVIYYNHYLPFKFHFDFQVAKEIVKIGFPIYLSGIVTFISGQGDRVVTAFLLGSYSLGIYQLVALISVVPNMLIGSVASALLPSSTYYYTKGIEMREMASSTFRLLTFLSLLLGVSSYAIAPYLVLKLFPEYSPGVEVLKILVLFITVTMPFQILSTFLIALNKNYRPFLVIGSVSAIEVVLVSFLLIPQMGILGAGIAQAGNAIITSVLYVIFSLQQGIITLDRKTIYSMLLISLSLISLFSWVIGALVIILGLKFLGIVTNKEIALIQRFIPPQLRFFMKILNLFT